MSHARSALAYVVGAACLVWLFYDLDMRRLASDAAGIHWGWVTLATVFNLLSYVAQGWRWELLLRPLGRITTGRASQAIFAGLFLSDIVPMRMGEVLRTWLVARWMKAKLSEVAPSVLVERFFDAVWLALCMGLTAIVIKLPGHLMRAADILGIAVLAATAAFAFLVVREGGKRRGLLGRLHDGLRDIGRSRALYLSFAGSLLVLVGQILAFWLIMRACGLPSSFWVGSVVLLIVHLGTLIPTTPANIGTYQFSIVVGLELFGVGKHVAAPFSLVAFALMTIPQWLAGWVALSRSGLTVAAARSVTAPRQTANVSS